MAAADLAGRDEVTAQVAAQLRGPTWRRGRGRHRGRAGRGDGPPRTPGRGPPQRRWPPRGTTPTRCSRWPLPVHSAQPVHAVGPASSRPSPTSRWAEGRASGPPTRSSTVAEAQKPMGASVISGCRAWPSQAPRSRSRTTGLATKASADRAYGAHDRVQRGALLETLGQGHGQRCAHRVSSSRPRPSSIPQGGRRARAGRPSGVDLRWTRPDEVGYLDVKTLSPRERSTGDGLEDHLHAHGRSPPAGDVLLPADHRGLRLHRRCLRRDPRHLARRPGDRPVPRPPRGGPARRRRPRRAGPAGHRPGRQHHQAAEHQRVGAAAQGGRSPSCRSRATRCRTTPTTRPPTRRGTPGRATTGSRAARSTRSSGRATPTAARRRR